MRCPFCSAPHDTRVIDSREADEGYQVKRRRECPQCKERFTTYETVELALPRIIKRDGTSENFNEQKLRAGMERALEKRPVSADAIDKAVIQIKKALIHKGSREIPALEIGELVMAELKNLDEVAFVRFASVYRSFQDVSEFTDTIAALHQS